MMWDKCSAEMPSSLEERAGEGIRPHPPKADRQLSERLALRAKRSEAAPRYVNQAAAVRAVPLKRLSDGDAR